MVVRFAVTAVLLCLLVACGQEAARSDSRRDQGTLLSYRVLGGIQGLDQTFTVGKTGIAVFSEASQPGHRTISRIPSREFDRLRAEVRRIGALPLDDEYGLGQVRDSQTVELSIEGHAVRVQSRQGVPPPLGRVLDRVARLHELAARRARARG